MCLEFELQSESIFFEEEPNNSSVLEQLRPDVLLKSTFNLEIESCLLILLVSLSLGVLSNISLRFRRYSKFFKSEFVKFKFLVNDLESWLV